MIFILVITHDVYQYIYRYDGLPEFLSWLSKEIENEFPEKHYVLVDTYVDPEGGDESLHAYIRLEKYDDSCHERIASIRRSTKYRDENPLRNWNFLLTTDYIYMDKEQ